MEKRCRLMRFYQMSVDHVRKRLVGAQGWVYYNWAQENEASMWGNNIKRVSKGYVAQEVDRIKNGRVKRNT